MAEVQLIRESESEIYLAHQPVAGIAIAVFGGVFAVIGRFVPDTTGSWIFTGVGLLFVALGIGAAFWRYELRLDLNARRYLRRKGFWPSPRETEGALDEIEGVVVVQEERTSSSKHGSRTYIVWVVKLPFRGEEKPVSVYEDRDEADAYRRAESLAKKLRAPLIDRTQMPERVTPWEKLDESVAERVASQSKGWGFSSASVSAPPAGSRIQYDQTSSRRMILLPAAGWQAISIFFVLFGLLFAGGGAIVLWAKASGAAVKESSEGAAWIVGTVFLLIGLGIALLGVLVTGMRDVVREDGDALVFASSAMGREWMAKRITKREIEQIEIRYAAEPASRSRGRLRIGGVSAPLGRTAVAPKQEIVVRSDAHVARLGKNLSDEEKQWLSDALTAMAAGA